MPGQSKTSPRQPTCCGAPPAGGSLLLALSGEQVCFASASGMGSCHCGPCFLRSVILWTVLTPEVSGQSVCTFYSIHCKLCFIICSRKKKISPIKSIFFQLKSESAGIFKKWILEVLRKTPRCSGSGHELSPVERGDQHAATGPGPWTAGEGPHQAKPAKRGLVTLPCRRGCLITKACL